MRNGLSCLVIASLIAFASACGPTFDIATGLSVTDMFSGWYDFGIENGLNKLVPSVTFRVKNVATLPVNEVQLLVSFWPAGADGDVDSKEVSGIGRESLGAGSTTDPILVRSAVGYTLEQPRSELFTHSQFKDFVAKIFAKRGGRIVPLGQFTIERRIIPHVDAPAGSATSSSK